MTAKPPATTAPSTAKKTWTRPRARILDARETQLGAGPGADFCGQS